MHDQRFATSHFGTNRGAAGRSGGAGASRGDTAAARRRSRTKERVASDGRLPTSRSSSRSLSTSASRARRCSSSTQTFRRIDCLAYFQHSVWTRVTRARLRMPLHVRHPRHRHRHRHRHRLGLRLPLRRRPRWGPERYPFGPAEIVQDRRIREKSSTRTTPPEIEEILRRGGEKMATLKEVFAKTKSPSERSDDKAAG